MFDPCLRGRDKTNASGVRHLLFCSVGPMAGKKILNTVERWEYESWALRDQNTGYSGLLHGKLSFLLYQ